MSGVLGVPASSECRRLGFASLGMSLNKKGDRAHRAAGYAGNAERTG